MLKFAVDYDGPIALRYPRGEAYDGLQEFRAPVEYGRSEMIYEGGHRPACCGKHGKDGGKGAGCSEGDGIQLHPCKCALCEAH